MSYEDWFIQMYGVGVDRPTEEDIEAELEQLEEDSEAEDLE